jgi:signal transduction histidine kinase
MRADPHLRVWLAWSAVVVVIAAGLGLVVSLLLQWPENPLGGIAAGLLLGFVAVPVAVALASSGHAASGRRVLVLTVVAGGLTGLAATFYLGLLLVLGRRPDESEREIVLLSLVATALAGAFAVPAGRSLLRWAEDTIPGRRMRPDEVLRSYTDRLTRSVPLDELLLQLVELLPPTLGLDAAEVWTGDGGRLTRVAGVPYVDVGREVTLDDGARVALVNARTAGSAWAEMWVPDLLAERDGANLRIVPLRHKGELLGMLVVERAVPEPFREEEDEMFADLAQQVGLVLHNVRLDAALEQTVVQLRARNEELAASRARVVAAADESRRRIERDLHDGAQQSLVGLIVKIGLLRSLLDSDTEAARSMVDELEHEIQATNELLRELGHGVYPPLLRDRGLSDALSSAATRSPRSISVRPERLGRYAAEIEAAIYFCCLEAMQNAAKYGGDAVTVRLAETDGRVSFSVSDDGPGFDVDATGLGQGLANMRDRVAAVGGEVVVESAGGKGTDVSGWVPARPPVTPRRTSTSGRP